MARLRLNHHVLGALHGESDTAAAAHGSEPKSGMLSVAVDNVKLVARNDSSIRVQ